MNNDGLNKDGTPITSDAEPAIKRRGSIVRIKLPLHSGDLDWIDPHVSVDFKYGVFKTLWEDAEGLAKERLRIILKQFLDNTSSVTTPLDQGSNGPTCKRCGNRK